MNQQINQYVSRSTPFVLASLISSYPDELFAEYTTALLHDEDLSLPEDFRNILFQVVQSEETINDLRSEYIDIFDRSKELNPLYETEYGRERAMFKANELSDISGFYKAFGFNLGGDGLTKEMPDHLSVEFEFYSLLIMKSEHLAAVADTEGCDIVLDARKKFLKDHLGRFVHSIGERPGVQSSPIYSKILNWCSEIVADEANNLEITLEKATWFASQTEKDAVCCGAEVAHVPS